MNGFPVILPVDSSLLKLMAFNPTHSLSTGVPQGSILGPLLFLIYMNDIPSSSECFKYILYADDTTLFSTIQISEAIPKDLNKHLAEVYNWLAVNKLSLNVKKRNIFLPELKINDISIERVQNFNFLGLNLNEHISWKNHIDIVANKLKKLSGVLNKLKRFLPEYILRTLYCTMVQSRLTYGILAWGFECHRFMKIQKRFMRIISISTYNAHTEPLFKQFELLPIKGLFDLNCLKFVYNFKKGNLPCHY